MLDRPKLVGGIAVVVVLVVGAVVGVRVAAPRSRVAPIADATEQLDGDLDELEEALALLAASGDTGGTGDTGADSGMDETELASAFDHRMCEEWEACGGGTVGPCRGVPSTEEGWPPPWALPPEPGCAPVPARAVECLDGPWSCERIPPEACDHACLVREELEVDL